ncbi:UDP-N-acetylmuramoyl-L-alanyl-D-glutamate--2,6-diaminopimelate ligase [Alteromonas sp. ALT199]|uniref:UDP-N-acetylmuramoyl-L-alanyl-D-glutamate--2, 6-diaminopimelate ligase n=1 Tax=unclassified Alteromonas TaxID=2614992 RepID=UPI001BE58B1C|nr:UDP-N-acetylmuramoyl-L-alanyl-D-glutamate--2,6-diaminopimelate ligase [Alteromonas sp. ALT199]MBT3134305.1 UDP-N-acetylmuramoyl-L-alanyl-D-glutamate--2,6-diaminopimelate ligase [Alteromonas sp. ALT199]
MVVSAFIQSIKALLAKFGVDAPDIRIEGLTLDSREVNTRLAFVAVKGHERDGRDFIPQAISLGARVILAQTEDSRAHGQMEMRDHSVIILLYELPQMLSALAAAFYDYPAQKMVTVAVTGTNGKTSTVQLLTQIKSALGTRSASIGTLGSSVFEGDETQWSNTPAENTTPDAIRMQYLLADFVQSEVRHTAFEASSHALVQGRLGTVKTDIAVFTNLTRDHLDYHGTMEEYGRAKRLLLQQPGLKVVVLNANDDESKKWDGAADKTVTRVWTGIDENSLAGKSEIVLLRDQNNPQSRHCFATNAFYHAGGCSFELVSSWGSAAISLPLFGKFNISNVLSAIGTLLAEGERFDDVVNAVNAITPVAGRMEVFPITGAANLVVDYAHTPDALEKVLLSAKFHTTGKVWCVFGCGGDRDKGKRPLMGQAAEVGADAIVITTDNSRSESPESIAKDIIAGLKNSELAVSIPDREQAIRHCLEHAQDSDIIIVAGKGHEDYQIIGDKKTNYNERAVVARLQQEYSK